VRSVPKTADVRPERAPQPQEAGNGRREPQADHQIERLSEEPEVPAVAEPVAATVSDGGEAAEPGAEPRPSEARDSEERGGEDRAGEDREGQGERRGRRRGRRGGRRRRGRHREDEGAPAEGNGEPPRESTLGPFGQESGGPAQALADQPAGEPSSERFEEREPARAPESVEERREERKFEEPAAAGRFEPAPAAAETREPRPAPAPEPPPPPAPSKPAAPPRRGWWNLRRG
jgi:ribonuclease E